MVTSDYKKWDMLRGCFCFMGFFISIIIAMGIYGLVAFGSEFKTVEILTSICVFGALGSVVFILISKSLAYHGKIKKYKQDRS